MSDSKSEVNMFRRVFVAGAFIIVVLIGTGCVHPIAFHPTDTSWHYPIQATKQDSAGLVAVIDASTAESTYEFRAMSTGIAHKWVARYGEMLGQVADVEMPQLVANYQRSETYAEPTAGEQRLTLVLTVSHYVFRDYHATLTLHAEGFGPDKMLVFSGDYTSEGRNESGKMLGAGAFGQKSAVRQSSLDAYRKAFDQMRPDLIAAFETLSQE